MFFAYFYYDRYHFFNVRLSLNYNLLYRFSLVSNDDPVAFIIISITTHIFYFLFRAYIGYGDVLLISALLFFPLQFTIYVILFTFVIAGLVALITMIFKPIKLLPLVPFIFISFFYQFTFLIMISINF